MRPDLQYLEEKFKKFNELCFSAQLPPVPMRIGKAKAMLGSFRHPRDNKGSRNPVECCICLSDRFDLPAEEVDATIVHEMIHYYLWYKKIKDDAPHGSEFRRVMDRLNRDQGLNLSVSAHSSANILDTDQCARLHIVCVSVWGNGARCLTVCARSRALEIYEKFKNSAEVMSMEWYASYNPWFNRFPGARTPKAWVLREEDYKSRFKDAIKLDMEEFL